MQKIGNMHVRIEIARPPEAEDDRYLVAAIRVIAQSLTGSAGWMTAELETACGMEHDRPDDLSLYGMRALCALCGVPRAEHMGNTHILATLLPTECRALGMAIADHVRAAHAQAAEENRAHA